MIPSVQYDAHDGRTSGQKYTQNSNFVQKWPMVEKLAFYQNLFGIKHCGNWYGKVQTQIRTYPNIFSS